MSSWRETPEPISEDKIKDVYHADVVVVGMGYSGSAAFRAAQESGAKTIGITKEKDRNHFVAAGAEIGHINSRFLLSRGVPKVDPIVFYNEMMKRSANRSNPELVMKFAQRSGENMDWWMEPFDEAARSNFTIRYWDKPNIRFHDEAMLTDAQINGYHFWYGTLFVPITGPNNTLHPDSSDCIIANQDIAVNQGAQLFYNMEAMQLVKENGRVAAVIARCGDGEYYRFNAKKGIILCTAGFNGSKEMLTELVSDVQDSFSPGDCFRDTPIPQDGSGIRMGVWAGGRLEPRPIATSAAAYAQLRGLNEAFGMLWLSSEGKRFCNELFGGTELASVSGMRLTHDILYNVFDEHVLEFAEWSPPMHYGFDFNDEGDARVLAELIEYAKTHAEGYCIVPNKLKLTNVAQFGPHAAKTGFRSDKQIVYYGKTPEELVKNAGLEEDVAKNVVDSIHRYNMLARSGRDEDYGRDPKVMPSLNGILFMEGRRPPNGRTVGFTCGAFVTDGNMNVLDENYKRIPGLYVGGNCCGGRFGLQYTTPIAGLSVGMSIVLGREVGIAAATNTN